MNNFIINKLKNKKIIIIWLWKQGTKLVTFFCNLWLKNNIIWICKTKKTKSFCEKIFSINVFLDLDFIVNNYKNEIWFIFIWVKPENIQDEIYFNLINRFSKVPVLIEKAFISQSKINNLNFFHPTWIIVEEYSYLDFFKNVNIIKNNIKKIDILSDLNYITYNEIVLKKLSLMSYIYWYLFFLEVENIKLLKTIKIYNWYKLIFLIKNKIIINFIFRITEKKYNYNTIIYYEDNTKSVFNANLDYFIFRWQKIRSNIVGWYFDIFLKNKIYDLLHDLINLEGDIKKINRFNKFNLFDNNIIL